MKIGIVGVGMVGGTISYGFKRLGHTVIEHDIKWPDSGLHKVLETDIVFICVPTPQSADGSCDTNLVSEVVEDLARYKYKGLAVIKSTVTPGTTNHLHWAYPLLRLAFCPEFLREKTAYTDFIDQHDVCIIGVDNTADYDLIKQAHGHLPDQFVRLEPLEAEFCKYFSNVFNALKSSSPMSFTTCARRLGLTTRPSRMRSPRERTLATTILTAMKTREPSAAIVSRRTHRPSGPM